MVLGLTQDAFGYILTSVDFESFRRYDYVSETSLGEHTLRTEDILATLEQHRDETPRSPLVTGSILLN